MRLQRDFSRLRVFICLAIFVLSGTAFAQTANNATIDCTGATPGAFTSISQAVFNSPDNTTFTIVSNCADQIDIQNRSNLNFFANIPVTITGSPDIQVFTISNSRNIRFSGPITVSGGNIGFVINDSQSISFFQVTMQNNVTFGLDIKNSQVQVVTGSISSNTRTGIVTFGGSLELDGVTVSNNGRLGISSQNTHLFLTDGNDLPTVVSNNGIAGIQLTNSSQGDFVDLQIINNAGNNFGLQAFTNTAVVMQGGSISGNSGIGVNCGSTAHCEFFQAQINGNTGGGIQITTNAELALDGGVQISGNTGVGISIDQHSAFASTGGNMISNNSGDALIVNALSTLDFGAPDTITATAGNLALNCNNGSLVTGDISTYKPKKCGTAFQAVPIH